MATTFRMTVQSVTQANEGQKAIRFAAIYSGDENDPNKEWAKYTPSAQFEAHVTDEVAERDGYEQGQVWEFVASPVTAQKSE